MKRANCKKILFCALILAVIALAFFVSENYVQLLLIQGESMEPSYHNLQPVLLDKNSGAYEAGDVIAFRCEALDAVLVKRIAACPGDSVSCRDGRLYVNDAPYFDCLWQESDAEGSAYVLEDGSYFVVGDNFELSRDSRYSEIGIVRADDIIGVLMS